MSQINLEDLHFFVGNQLSIVSKDGVPPDDIASAVNEILGKLDHGIEVRAREEKYTQPAFLPGHEGEEPVPVRNLSFDLDPEPLFITRKGNNQILEIVKDLDRVITAKEPDELDESEKFLNENLLAVTPDWLVAPSPPPVSTFGGPGIEPTPDDLPEDPPVNFEFYQGAADMPDVGEHPVTVVILDTCPPHDAIKIEGNHLNGLLDALNTNLHLHKLTENEDQLKAITKHANNEYFHAPGHRYNMSSHGLFVAGIIHSIMPNAEIHLIRVLNKYGMGTVDLVRQGIEKALTLKGDGPLIINMSLTMVFPYAKPVGDNEYRVIDNADDLLAQFFGLEDVLLNEASETAPIESTLDSTLAQPDTIAKRLRLPFELAVRGAKADDIIFVAASGNERKPEHVNTLPLTLYPAAFDDVIGVGALQDPLEGGEMKQVNTVKYASYTCTVDKPASEGFATLGGDVGPGNGIIGVWLNEPKEEDDKPDPSNPKKHFSSDNGWIYWAGTSFATPIISGALARLIGAGETPQTALQWLHNGWKEKTEPPPKNAVPHVVLVRQTT